MIRPFRLGTRGSPLALWQANYVADRIRPAADPRRVELVRIVTDGDQNQVQPLAAMGGFGVFTRAIQQALLDDACDVAVHSLKDLPTVPVDGVGLIATPPRGPTGDAFVSTKYATFDSLPQGAVVGTSSLRRRAQALNYRPDLKMVDLRGNVETRLRKLTDLDLDGIVLAEAGLQRLGFEHLISEVLDPAWMLPAVGQGAIGLECRDADDEAIEAAGELNDLETWRRVTAERSMLWALGGGCLVPIGVRSVIRDGVLGLRGSVLSADGTRRVTATHTGPATAPLAVGQELAAMLLAEGAGEFLARGA